MKTYTFRIAHRSCTVRGDMEFFRIIADCPADAVAQLVAQHGKRAYAIVSIF